MNVEAILTFETMSHRVEQGQVVLVHSIIANVYFRPALKH